MRAPPHPRAPLAGQVETVHHRRPGYPRALELSPEAPPALHVLGVGERGGAQRLARLLAEPAVAIVGCEQASDYGIEIAAGIARGLAAAGVTVLGAFANGIAAAAHAGALEVAGPNVTVAAGGVDRAEPAGRRELYQRILATGCAVSEQPCGAPRRAWSSFARARIVAALAAVTVVVEADESPRDLCIAHAAQALSRTVAAIPGRVTSPLSRGANALLASGAPLVRGPADVLDLLYGLDAPSQHPGAALPSKLQPRLLALLERVGAGADTPDKLARPGEDPGETLLALTELELMGLLARGDGGRYVPRQSLAGI